MPNQSNTPPGTSVTNPAITRVQDAGSNNLANVAIGIGDTYTPSNELIAHIFASFFNGASYDRAKTASAMNMIAQSGVGVGLTALPGMWSAFNNPAVGGQASAVKAAGGAGTRHILTGIMFSAIAAVAPALTPVNFNILDGVTTIATIQLILPANTGQVIPPISLTGLSIVGSPATSMTGQFSAGVANVIESVTIFGYDAF